MLDHYYNGDVVYSAVQSVQTEMCPACEGVWRRFASFPSFLRPTGAEVNSPGRFITRRTRFDHQALQTAVSYGLLSGRRPR